MNSETTMKSEMVGDGGSTAKVAIEPTVIVLSWYENTGIRMTGNLIKRDGNWFEETEPCKKGCACIFSRRMEEFDRANDYAKSMRQDGDKFNIQITLMSDTADVLERARNAAMV